jgi:glycosyltransferase involved in cell wall biosynthesis
MQFGRFSIGIINERLKIIHERAEAMTLKTIGTDNPSGKGYTQTFSSLPFAGYKVVKTKNRYPGLAGRLKRLSVPLPPAGRIYLSENKKEIDLLHFWNKINLNNQPWVTSLEGAIFHFDFSSKPGKSIALRRLSSEGCRRILPFSQNAYQEIEYFLTKAYFAYHDRIVNKMRVSRPVQVASITNYEEKELNATDIVFTLVGDEFFRKGGEEILKVFDHLLQKNYPIKLQVVSRLTQKYSPFSGDNVDIAECRRIIDTYPTQISVMQDLPHENVIALFKNSHVGMLPSYSDTYGFSVLEAQSAGCPVITTDVRAFPEINNDQIGWLINLPKDDEVHDALMWTPKDKAHTSTVLYNALLSTVEKIVHSPHQIREKGMNALNKIREEYNPCKRALEMESVYNAALGDKPH